LQSGAVLEKANILDFTYKPIYICILTSSYIFMNYICGSKWFLPRCMQCRRGLEDRLSVRLSHACIVTKR